MLSAPSILSKEIMDGTHTWDHELSLDRQRVHRAFDAAVNSLIVTTEKKKELDFPFLPVEFLSLGVN